MGIHAACSVLCLFFAALCLRPLRLGWWLRRRREVSGSSRPEVGDDPMLWKEWYAPGRRSHVTVGLTLIVVGVLLFYPQLAPAEASFREWRTSWSNNATPVSKRMKLNESLRQLNAGLCVLGLVVVTALAAGSITGEHERRTWTNLTMTLISGREIVAAKASGTLWNVRGLLVAFVALWAIGMGTGAVHPLGALAAAASLFVYARYAAAIGVLLSLLSKSSERAIGTAVLVVLIGNALALLFVPLDLLGSLAGSWSTLYLAGVSPLVEWFSLVSPVEIQWWLEPRSWEWEEQLRLPWGLWSTRIRLTPGLIWVYLASLALHALATMVVMRAAAWWYDTERDGPRRRRKEGVPR
jgi:ABC-type transport system involved in multi-copper enzyme maturation permease subunit